MLCCSYPFLCNAPPNFAVPSLAIQVLAVPFRCSSALVFASPLPNSAALINAFADPCVTDLCISFADPILAGLCCAVPLLRFAVLFRYKAVRIGSMPLPCASHLCRCISLPCSSLPLLFSECVIVEIVALPENHRTAPSLYLPVDRFRVFLVINHRIRLHS